MFFVVPSNDSFNFPQGGIKYIVIVVVVVVVIVVVVVVRPTYLHRGTGGHAAFVQSTLIS